MSIPITETLKKFEGREHRVFLNIIHYVQRKHPEDVEFFVKSYEAIQRRIEDWRTEKDASIIWKKVI